MDLPRDYTRLTPFPDGDALAAGLAEAVAEDLRDAIARNGKAALAVSGGSTPKRFFQQLSAKTLDWSKVTVTLVDERWVGEHSERSNAALVKRTLLQDQAAAARFLPLYRELPEPGQALSEIEHDLDQQALPLDVAILGMGEDGHTASFFPGGDYLGRALDLSSSARVLPMHAEGAGEPRITLTLPVLAASGRLYLHVEGQKKADVLGRACGDEGDHFPVRAVLTATNGAVQTYWSP
ncbi:MAG: 6-phosphogluconolactonase [Pseudoxanthomonas sp.]